MDRKSIHEKIAELTELININNNRLFLHDDKIAQLEIDVLRKNVIELYEQINLLHINNLKNKEAVSLTSANNDKIALENFEVEEPAPELKQEIPVVEEKVMPPTPEIPKLVEIVEEVENTIKTEKTTQVVEAITEEIVVEKVAPPVEEIKVEELKKPEIIATPPVEKPPQQALFHESSELKTTSAKNNSLQDKENKNVFEKYRSAKIDSIKKAISILKKYEYQSALFKNDSKAYTDAIEMLDNSASGEVAISLLENSWRKQYEWGEKQENLVEELKELVYRRHS
jgi:hypothetical protein